MNLKRGGLVVAIVLFAILFFINRGAIELSSQTNFTCTKIATNGYQLNSTLTLKSPNLLSSTIQSVNEKFYINGKYIGELNNELAQGIPGLKETQFPLTIRFSAEELAQIFPTQLPAAGKALITVTGQITFSNFTGSGTLNINETDSVTFIN